MPSTHAHRIPPPPSILTHAAQPLVYNTECNSSTYPRTRPVPRFSGAQYTMLDAMPLTTCRNASGIEHTVQDTSTLRNTSSGTHYMMVNTLRNTSKTMPLRPARYSIPVPSHKSCNQPISSHCNSHMSVNVNNGAQQCHKLFLEAQEYQQKYGREAVSSNIDSHVPVSNKETCLGCTSEGVVVRSNSVSLNGTCRASHHPDKRHTTSLNSYYYVPDPTSYSFDRDDYSFGDPNQHNKTVPGVYRHSLNVDYGRPSLHQQSNWDNIHPQPASNPLALHGDNTDRKRWSSVPFSCSLPVQQTNEIIPSNRSQSYTTDNSSMPEFLVTTKVSTYRPISFRPINTVNSTNHTPIITNSWNECNDSSFFKCSTVSSSLCRSQNGRLPSDEASYLPPRDSFSRASSNSNSSKTKSQDHSNVAACNISLQPSQYAPIKRMSFLPPIPIISTPDKPSRHQYQTSKSEQHDQQYQNTSTTRYQQQHSYPPQQPNIAPRVPARSHKDKSWCSKSQAPPTVCSFVPPVCSSNSTLSSPHVLQTFASSSQLNCSSPPIPPSPSLRAPMLVFAPTTPIHHHPYQNNASGGASDGPTGDGGDTASSVGEDCTNTNIQHISEREHDDLDQDPSLHPTAGPLFLSRARHAQQSEWSC